MLDGPSPTRTCETFNIGVCYMRHTGGTCVDIRLRVTSSASRLPAAGTRHPAGVSRRPAFLPGALGERERNATLPVRRPGRSNGKRRFMSNDIVIRLFETRTLLKKWPSVTPSPPQVESIQSSGANGPKSPTADICFCFGWSRGRAAAHVSLCFPSILTARFFT